MTANDYKPPAPSPAGGKDQKTRITLDMAQASVLGVFLLIMGGLCSAAIGERTDRQEREAEVASQWRKDCVETSGGAVGKIGDVDNSGANVAFPNGTRTWYPLAELTKTDCQAITGSVLDTTAKEPVVTIEEVSRSKQAIHTTRQEIELLKLKLEQAQVARRLYETLNSGSDRSK